MKTFKRICIKDYTVTDQAGSSCTINRGQEYITSDIRENKNVIVFTNYWIPVPVEYFAGEILFTE